MLTVSWNSGLFTPVGMAHPGLQTNGMGPPRPLGVKDACP